MWWSFPDLNNRLATKRRLAAYLGAELKLTLSADKTNVTALTEGFDFLGHRIRLRWDDTGVIGPGWRFQ